MNDTELLVLNGSPGSGKSSVANAIAEHLRQSGIAHALIEFDELGRVYPEPAIPVGWANLRAMWPNYLAIPNLKVILPVCIGSNQELEDLQNAAPCKKCTIVDLVAEELVLKARVTNREPNEYWRVKLRGLVDKHVGKNFAVKLGDFRIRTDDKSIEDTAREIIGYLGWKVSGS